MIPSVVSNQVINNSKPILDNNNLTIALPDWVGVGIVVILTIALGILVYEWLKSY